MQLPRILGHEIAGEILDPGSSALMVGQRVACLEHVGCGHCQTCTSGHPQLCSDMCLLGVDSDGGLAEVISVPARNVMPVSETVSFPAAAITMDGVATCWHALHARADPKAGELLLITGAGGLGLNAVQIAQDLGLRVVVVEPQEKRRNAAVALGAELAVDPQDVLIATAALHYGGRLVCCGYYPGRDFELDSLGLVFRELTIVGSRAADPSDVAAALRAVEEGRLSPPIGASFSLEQVNTAFNMLAEGSAPGRIVVEIGR
jgi:D-arabinose 1-dehydrogenase-like Zn-dependent alcohol dehydrogenase